MSAPKKGPAPLNPQQFYHGSPDEISGSVTSAQSRSDKSSGPGVGNSDRQNYFTTDRDVAYDHALGKGNEKYGYGNYTPHVYSVEPTGKFSADKHMDQSFKSPHPLKVVGET